MMKDFKFTKLLYDTTLGYAPYIMSHGNWFWGSGWYANAIHATKYRTLAEAQAEAKAIMLVSTI